MKINSKTASGIGFAFVTAGAIAITTIAVLQALNGKFAFTTLKLPAFVTNLTVRKAAFIAGGVGAGAILTAVAAEHLLRKGRTDASPKVQPDDIFITDELMSDYNKMKF